MLTSQSGRPICKKCGVYPVHPNGKSKLGYTKWRTRCSKCSGMGKIKKENSYRFHKKTYCELCGFIPVNKCQLDVDHIDGNHNNNSINNLQTLCANCHRLKTFLNKEGPYKKVKI